MYLTYEEYQNMGGTLEETTFNDYEFEAECIVNWYTFDRLKNETEYPEALVRLMYHLITMIDKQMQATNMGDDGSGTTDGGKAVTSQSNDGVSISYNVMSASEIAQSMKDEMGKSVQRYLQGVVNSLGRKVLYRGLYPGE